MIEYLYFKGYWSWTKQMKGILHFPDGGYILFYRCILSVFFNSEYMCSFSLCTVKTRTCVYACAKLSISSYRGDTPYDGKRCSRTALPESLRWTRNLSQRTGESLWRYALYCLQHARPFQTANLHHNHQEALWWSGNHVGDVFFLSPIWWAGSRIAITIP